MKIFRNILIAAVSFAMTGIQLSAVVTDIDQATAVSLIQTA